MIEKLNEKMIEWVNEHRLCPGCHKGSFLDGPHGGNSVNVRCDNCGAEYCFAFLGNVVVFADKLDRDQAGLYPGPFSWPMPLAELEEACTKLVAEHGLMPGPGLGLGVSDDGEIEIGVHGPLAAGEMKTMKMSQIMATGVNNNAGLEPLIKATARFLAELVRLQNKETSKRN